MYKFIIYTYKLYTVIKSEGDRMSQQQNWKKDFYLWTILTPPDQVSCLLQKVTEMR